MRNRTKTLSYEATLAQLLGLIGSPVEVTITPTEGDWTASVARISGVLHRGERRRLTLGKGPEDDDSEVVFFSLDAAGTTGFAVSRRAFGGAKVERDSEVVAVTVVVAPNEVVVAASR